MEREEVIKAFCGLVRVVQEGVPEFGYSVPTDCFCRHRDEWEQFAAVHGRIGPGRFQWGPDVLAWIADAVDEKIARESAGR